jgi:hypothetical protein
VPTRVESKCFVEVFSYNQSLGFEVLDCRSSLILIREPLELIVDLAQVDGVGHTWLGAVIQQVFNRICTGLTRDMLKSCGSEIS